MDPIIRIVTVTLLLVLAFGVLVRPHPWRWRLCFVLLAMSLSAFVFHNAASNVVTSAGHLTLILHFLAKMTVLFLWWFVQSSFSDRFRFDFTRLSVGAFWLGLVLHDMWRTRQGIEGVLDYLSAIAALALVLHLVWTLLAGREGDLRLKRRAARLWFPATAISLLLIDLTIDFTLGFGWRAPAFVLAQNSATLFLVLGVFMSTVQIDANQYAAGPKVLRSDEAAKALSQNARLIQTIMEEEKLFLNPELRLSDIVKRLPLSEANTRSLIYSEFGCEHFRTFLNRYRVQEAQRLMCAPHHKEDKLIAIAFDSGFASLASFQRAFKRELGQTPSDWRRKTSPA